MMDAPLPGEFNLRRLEVLHGFKRLLGRDPVRNVTPFSEEQVVCYRTDVSALDVPEIFLETRNLLEATVGEVNARQTAQIVLLAGNPGMGKSHLLNHFRDAETAARLGYVLVSPTNHWDIGDFEERLLDSLLSSLVHPSPDGPHLLLTRVVAIAFTALGQLLDQPGGIRSFQPFQSGFFRRLVSPSGRAFHERMVAAFATRDEGVFRRLDFNKFTGYVCDRYLAEPGNPLHRYVLRVLLCYLFPEEREFVVHWLRGKNTQGHFTKRFGVEEQLDRTYKRMDAVRLLTSLFAGDVSDGLAQDEASGPAAKVFLLAFDQSEGRNELFDSAEDWHTFFGQLAELYNSLPNVMILFTMTLQLRDVLFSKIEKQFQDRIRRDERFVLRYIEDAEMLSLYRKRLDHWIGPGEEPLRTKVQEAGESYLPFTRDEVLGLANQQTLRKSLELFDEGFRAKLLAVATDIPHDYLTWKREFQGEQTGEVYDDTKSHLDTVERLLGHFGSEFATARGITLQEVIRQEQDGLDHLALKFHDPATPGRWVRVFLVRLTYNYKAKLAVALALLRNREKARNFLWVVRAHPISLEQLEDRASQAFAHHLTPETETSYRAMSAVAAHRNYPPDVWLAGIDFIVREVQKTYLADMLVGVEQAIKNLPRAGEADQEATDSTGEPSIVEVHA